MMTTTKIRKLAGVIALTTTFALGVPAAMPVELPGAAISAFANPPCGPANDGERIDVAGNDYECAHIPMPVGPALWDWLPVV